MEFNELPENIRAEIEALRADAQRYRNEARRYRDEAKNILFTVRDIQTDLAILPEVKKTWAIDAIPDFPAPFGIQDVGEGSFMVYHEKSAASEFEAYKKELLTAGFSEYSAFSEGTLTAVTLYNDRTVVNLSLATDDAILRAVVDARSSTELPPITPVPAGTLPVVFRSECDLYREVDCGMSYFFRLSDGTFFVIDGGWRTPNIAEDLLNNLCRIAGGEKPVISAWLFTHAHMDHIGAFCNLAERFADRVELRSVIYSFPGECALNECNAEFERGYIRKFRDMLSRFENVKIYKARTGQRYCFAGMDIDILFSYEDFKPPHRLHHFNETSLVFRMKTNGQTWMFLGDVTEKGSAILVSRFGETLRSDIVQVAHHGYAGGTDEIYDAIAAPIVLWPAPKDLPDGRLRYANPEWSPITRRMVAKYAKNLYVSAEGSTELTLPLPEEKSNI